MTSALDDYIHWLQQDARRNHQHILMAKMAKEKETELLISAFNAGIQWQKDNGEKKTDESNGL
jgi:hypothetical protein